MDTIKNRQKTALFSLGTIIFDTFTLQNKALTIRKVPHKSDGQAFRLWNPQSVINGGWFSRARVTRAPSLGIPLFCFHNLHRSYCKEAIFRLENRRKNDRLLTQVH